MCLQLMSRDVGHIRLQYLGTLVSCFGVVSMKFINRRQIIRLTFINLPFSAAADAWGNSQEKRLFFWVV